jgi:hypothetical protein
MANKPSAKSAFEPFLAKNSECAENTLQVLGGFCMTAGCAVMTHKAAKEASRYHGS